MDPLKPFTDLIRSLRSSTQRAAPRATPDPQASLSSAGHQTQAQAICAPTQVGFRLQSRLRALREWNSARARELFVEHALLMEFGSDLGRDQAFADLVRRVSAQLATEPALGARLDQLLQDLAADTSDGRR